MKARILAFSVKATEAELDITVYDQIGKGWWTGEGVVAKDILSQLQKFKGKTINVRLNSGGGDTTEGSAIYSLLAAHSARKIVHIDGLAASAASVIAMAGDEIRISSSALMMIHKCWTRTVGNADELCQRADLMRKIDCQMASIYTQARIKRGVSCSTDECLELMSKETWMTGEEAVQMGFADVVTDAVDVAASFEGLNPPPDILARRAALVAASTKRTTDGDDDMSKKLLEALGAKTEEEALALIAAATEEVASLKAKVSTLEPGAALLAQVETAIGSSGEAVLGAIVALQDASGRLVAVTEERDKLKAERDAAEKAHAEEKAKAEFEALVTKGINDGTITPGLEAWARSVNADVLRGFLAQAPRAIPAVGSAPPAQPAKPSALAGLTDDDKAVAAAMGISLEAFAQAKAQSTKSTTDEE